MVIESVKEVPDKFFYLNKDGSFRETMREDDKYSVQEYWSTKTRQIALLMLVSMGVLFMVLLAESNVLGVMWEGLLNVVNVIMELYWGLF